MPNIFEPSWDHELPDPPFRIKLARVGGHAGAEALGASLYELEPGGAVSPYHLHHANEEMAIVVSGTPTLRTPEGERTLAPGELVAFRTGPEGAHQISNADDAGEPARVLIVSTKVTPDVAEHLDTGTWLAMTGDENGKVFPSGTDVPPMEAVLAAMRKHDGAS